MKLNIKIPTSFDCNIQEIISYLKEMHGEIVKEDIEIINIMNDHDKVTYIFASGAKVIHEYYDKTTFGNYYVKQWYTYSP